MQSPPMPRNIVLQSGSNDGHHALASMIASPLGRKDYIRIKNTSSQLSAGVSAGSTLLQQCLSQQKVVQRWTCKEGRVPRGLIPELYG